MAADKSAPEPDPNHVREALDRILDKGIVLPARFRIPGEENIEMAGHPEWIVAGQDVDFTLRPEQLIIVQRDQPDVLAAVQARYGDAAIIVDRRQEERRHSVRPVPAERRERSERRRALLPPEELLWRDAYYRIVYRAPGAEM